MKKTMRKEVLLGLTVLLLMVTIFQGIQIGELKQGMDSAKETISSQIVVANSGAQSPVVEAPVQSEPVYSGMVGGC